MMIFFVSREKYIIKFIWKCKGTGIAKTILEKKNQVGGLILYYLVLRLLFPGSSAGKESTCNAGDPGSIPGSGSSPGE